MQSVPKMEGLEALYLITSGICLSEQISDRKGDKRPLAPALVWHRQLLRFDGLVAIKDDVQVKRPRAPAYATLQVTAGVFLTELEHGEQLVRRTRCRDKGCGVQERRLLLQVQRRCVVHAGRAYYL